MADTKKDTKKVKTDEKAAETIVDEVTAESADTAETTTTDVNVRAGGSSKTEAGCKREQTRQ